MKVVSAIISGPLTSIHKVILYFLVLLRLDEIIWVVIINELRKTTNDVYHYGWTSLIDTRELCPFSMANNAMVGVLRTCGSVIS